MTDAAQTQHPAAPAIIKRVMIKAALLVGIAAVVALIFLLVRNTGERWWSMPASVLFGGALGLLNFRWLAFAIERKLSKQVAPKRPSNPAIVILNGVKLSAIFIVLFVVIKWQLVHIFGLVIGLSLCFLAIIWEGLTLIKNTHDQAA